MKDFMEQPDNGSHILKNGLGKNRNVFQPPAGYFEKLEENISLRITPIQKETTAGWNWQPAWAFILSVCILTATFRFQQSDYISQENPTSSHYVSLEEEEITTELLIESGIIMEFEDHLLDEAYAAAGIQENRELSDPVEMEAICDYLIDNSHYSELTIENNHTTE